MMASSALGRLPRFRLPIAVFRSPIGVEAQCLELANELIDLDNLCNLLGQKCAALLFLALQVFGLLQLFLEIPCLLLLLGLGISRKS